MAADLWASLFLVVPVVSTTFAAFALGGMCYVTGHAKFSQYLQIPYFQGAGELTVFCGMWNYSNRLCEALHVDLERPDKRIEFQDE